MWNIIEFGEVGSTNRIAGEMLSRGEARHGDVVQARHQTGGRGRGAGRTWSDEPGSSLLMSIILEKFPEPVNLLQYGAALGILTALRNIAEGSGILLEEIILKWPNDILIRRKKVCGILLEAQWNASSMRSAVIGIGVNVKQKSFSEELAGIATSLSQCGILANVNEVRDQILVCIKSEFFSSRSDETKQESIIARLQAELKWMSNLGSLMLTNIDGSVFTDLTFDGISDSGALKLRQSDGSMITAHSGSLSWA